MFFFHKSVTGLRNSNGKGSLSLENCEEFFLNLTVKKNHENRLHIAKVIASVYFFETQCATASDICLTSEFILK